MAIRSILAVLVASSLVGCAGANGPASPQDSASSQLGRKVEEVPRSSESPTSVQPPLLSKSEPVAADPDLAKVRRTADRFFAAYVRFLYGRIPASALPDIDARLRSQLARARPLVTPAERSAVPKLVHLTVAAAGPPVSAIATATISSFPGRYRLTVTLESRHRRWIVVAVDG